MAVLIIEALEGLTVYERSPKDGGGFDYFLIQQEGAGNEFSDENFFAVASSRLEVSGILRGEQDEIDRRCREKLNRLKERVHPLPAYVIIVEFGSVRARIEKL